VVQFIVLYEVDLTFEPVEENLWSAMDQTSFKENIKTFTSKFYPDKEVSKEG